MATLKSIKNKYLTSTDASVFGVTTNTENVSLLSFKLATADSLSKFNLVDGFTDDYNDATGVDDSGSTGETRDSANYYWAKNVDEVFTFTAKGGGAGGNRSDTQALQDGSDGGSGGGGGSGGPGGGGHTTSGGTSTQGANTPAGWNGYGNTGGTGRHVSGAYEGGGGGAGANNNGTGSSGASGGGGGGGKAFTTSGSSVTYSGGGGASGNNGGTPGGSGGGGSSGSSGSANTGGGGGSGGDANSGNFSPGNGGTGTVWFRFTPSGGSDTQTQFTANGTWTVPTGVTATEVLLVGGGGPGGKGGSPGGGGGGGILHHSAFAVTAGNVWTITRGAGGSATGSTSTKGTNGGDTIMSYTNQVSTGTMTLKSEAYTAQSAPDTVRIILDEYTSTGSSTLNTDIKAYASRDNGTTYTQITLASQGTIETNHRLLSGSVDVSGQPSGTSVKYKIETLNQSLTKQTRVYGTSMAWA